MFMKMTLIFIFTILVSCSGCGTLATHSPLRHSDTDVPFGIYNGVRWDYYQIANSGEWPWAFDFPFSLAGDTLFLPYDVVVFCSLNPVP
jgi:uncharacterized protein YceK